MTLRNLLKIGRLVEHQAEPEEIRRLLRSAERALRDTRVDTVSRETRFDAAYRCILQAATAALWAQGYRTSTSSPGHHQTALQALVHTAGLPRERIAVLDRLRHKRNLVDYTGEEIDEGSVTVCIEEAKRLLPEICAEIRV